MPRALPLAIALLLGSATAARAEHPATLARDAGRATVLSRRDAGTTAGVPAQASYALMATGVAGLALAVRRRGAQAVRG